MTNPKSKADTESGKLSKTCITHVYEWLKSQPEFYGRSINFKSKYTDKGNVCEDSSIVFASNVYGWGNVQKNTEFSKNEYLTGTADLILPKSVEDIKNSWSQKTFPLFDTEIPVDGYGWQLQGYMELYDRPQAGLIYTLMDAPEWLIEKEARSRAFYLGMEDVETELFEEVKKEMTYSNFPDDLRIKRFFLDRDKKVMESVYERVELIRKFIDNL